MKPVYRDDAPLENLLEEEGDFTLRDLLILDELGVKTIGQLRAITDFPQGLRKRMYKKLKNLDRRVGDPYA